MGSEMCIRDSCQHCGAQQLLPHQLPLEEALAQTVSFINEHDGCPAPYVKQTPDCFTRFPDV